MRGRKAIPVTFNMSFGLIPVILCMILSEFIPDEYALYACSLLGIAYSFSSYYLSGRKIYNFVLYISTAILIILSLATLLPRQMFPSRTIPFTLEVMMFILTAALFYGQNILKRIFNAGQCSKCDDLIGKSIDSSIVSARVISIMGALHCITIMLFLIAAHPLSHGTNLILFYILPPMLLLFSIGINQVGIHFANQIMDDEEEIPIVNEQGNVTGRTFKSEAPIYKDTLINPVIRIAFICNGMIFLCSRKPDCVIDQDKTDIPLEGYLLFGEKPEKGVNRLIHEAYPKGAPIQPRFSIKHHFKNEETDRIIYLYIANIENEETLCIPYFKDSKLWTFQQIEQNLDKNYFCECFEDEYLHLKEVVKIWEEFK